VLRVNQQKNKPNVIQFCYNLNKINKKYHFNAMNSVHFCSITLRSNQMHYFYYLKLKTIYNISL
jgi:hypothetical protein